MKSLKVIVAIRFQAKYSNFENHNTNEKVLLGIAPTVIETYENRKD